MTVVFVQRKKLGLIDVPPELTHK